MRRGRTLSTRESFGLSAYRPGVVEGYIFTRELGLGMKPEQIIEESIREAQLKGVLIVRGPLFIWGSGELPEACDCSGAVLLAYGRAKRGFPEGWLSDLCVNILGKDTFWWWRFDFGFNQRRCLQMYTEDHGKYTYFDDDVSKMAAALSKRVLADGPGVVGGCSTGPSIQAI